MKDARPRSRRHRVLVALPLVATAIVIAATVATVSEVAGGQEPTTFVGLAILGMFLIPYTTVGALIEDRRPGQVVGRICLTIGVLLGVSGLLLVAAATVDSLPGLPQPLGAALTVVGTTILVLVLLLSEPLLVSRFPNGREPGRSGALVDGLLAVAGAVVLPWILMGLGMGIEILGVDPDVLATVFGVVISFALSLGSILACVGLVRRYARGSSIVRAQIRWFAAAIGTSIVFFVLFVLVFLTTFLFRTTAADLDDAWTVGAILFVLWMLSLLLPPVAIGIAILRHHLYDIDRIVSRSLGYAGVTGVLVVVFAATAIGLSALLGSLAQGETLAVAASTLFVFALFGPLRRRAQSAVDRRFDRSHYDASRTINALTQRLRDDVDLDRLETDVLGVVDKTFRPASTSVWLRARPTSRTTTTVTIPGRRLTTTTP